MQKKVGLALCLGLVLVLALVGGAWAGNVTITQITAKTVDEGKTLEFTVTAETTSTTGLLFSTGNFPTGAVLTANTQSGKTRTAVFSWTPNYKQAGVYSNVTITATEDKRNPDSASTIFSISVGNVNRPPELQAIGARSVDEGQPITFTVNGSDPDDEDVLTFSASNLPTGATFDQVSRTFSWTPNFNQAGNYDVLFKVTDNGTPAQSDSETVTITVGNVNRPPILDPIGSKTVDENVELKFAVNGSDPDGDGVQYSVSNLPTGAIFNPATQWFTWTPDYTQSGNYKVTFTITDNGSPALSASEEVTITVNNVNRPPVLDPIGNQTIDEGKNLTFTLTATDPDGDSLTFSVSDNLPKGATFDPETRTFTWTPDYDQAGTYANIVFSVSDGLLFDYETITITVGNVNRPPALNPIGPKTVNEGEKLEFTISASDPDGDPLTYSADSDGAGGSLPPGASFDPVTQTFSWTPDYNQAGNYEVYFCVTDSGNLVAQEKVTIAVGNVNRKPSITTSSGGSIYGIEGKLIEFMVTASDPDNDNLTLSCSHSLSGNPFDAKTGKFSWTPNYGTSGTYTVTFKVTDDGDPNESAETTVIISVDAPKPSELINSIVAYVLSLKLDKNVENSYIANLKKVEGFIAKGQLTPAINQLNATIQKVDQDLKKGGLIKPEDAAQLKLMINELLSMLTK